MRSNVYFGYQSSTKLFKIAGFAGTINNNNNNNDNSNNNNKKNILVFGGLGIETQRLRIKARKDVDNWGVALSFFKVE